MPAAIKFRITNAPDKLLEIYSLCGTEWGGKLSPRQFGETLTQNHLKDIENGKKPIAFYFEDVETGKVIMCAVVKQMKGFYKDADRSLAISSIPDPATFGVRNVTVLLLCYVFCHKDYRGRGLAKDLIEKVIEYTEDKLVDEHIALSKEEKKDSFKSMVMTDGKIDKNLANYYLGKQYFWVLYSGVQDYYKIFGFKSYPLDFYKVPTSIITDEQERIVRSLINKEGTNDPSHVGKHLRFLHSSKKQDQDIIQFILQDKELEILTDLNKLIFHSELAGSHKSSSSLTNLSSMLQMSKLGSNIALTAINEGDNQGSLGRRKSSIQEVSVPKFSFKPDYNSFLNLVSLEQASAKYLNDENALEYTDIQGAILTNELQEKSYYILWCSFKQQMLCILAIGELKFDMFGSMADPTGMGGRRSRRGSSFTGLNDLGGFNFQDLDLLISTACLVAKNRPIPKDNSVFVSVNDLPTNIPIPVLYDYFMNYLPKNFEMVHSPADETTPAETSVEIVTDADVKLGVLPMLRRFGKTSPEFNLDWTSDGLWSWG